MGKNYKKVCTEMSKYVLTERSELFEPNVYIEHIVDIEGPVNEKKIINAVKHAFQANESLMSCILINSDGTAQYKRMAESGCSVSVVNKDWQDIIRENERNLFAIDKGELMRVFITRNNMKYRLLVMAHHLAGDGKSITYFIMDVMKSLNGEKLEFKAMNNITKDNFQQEARIPFLIRLQINRINKKWERCGRVFLIHDYYELHISYWSSRRSVILTHHFSKHEIDELHAKCRDKKISINSIVASAFLKADRNNHRVGMAVSIRSDNDHSMSNQVTGISIKMKYNYDEGIITNAGILQKKTYKVLKNSSKKLFVLKFISMLSPSLVDSILMHIYGLYENKVTEEISEIIGYKEKKMSDLAVTNLTRLDIPNVYGKYKIKNFIFVPPVVSYADHLIGVASMDDGMNITYHFMSDKNYSKEKKFFDSAIENIRNEIANQERR